MAKPKIALIIVNWNGIEDTLECLQSISKSSQKNHSLTTYVVDNASTDDSVTQIKKLHPEIRLITNSKNLGFSGGNNIGLQAALDDNKDYFILLNNDTTVSPDTFKLLIEGSLKENFDIASPKIFFYPDREFHKESYNKDERGNVIWYAGGRIDWDNVWPSHIGVDEVDHGQLDKSTETEFATGCCMLINKKVLDKIGFLDTKYTAYFEDNDFCQRAKTHEFKIGFISNSTMWHKNAGSTGGPGSKNQKKLIDKSRLTFALRYAPIRAKLALFRQSFTI